jgi:hypothetical protein
MADSGPMVRLAFPANGRGGPTTVPVVGSYRILLEYTNVRAEVVDGSNGTRPQGPGEV